MIAEAGRPRMRQAPALAGIAAPSASSTMTPSSSGASTARSSRSARGGAHPGGPRRARGRSGAHCVRITPGNMGGHDKVGQVVERARALGIPLRVGVNSGSLPERLRQLEYDDRVEALVTAATEMVELMERLEFSNFKVSMKS